MEECYVFFVWLPNIEARLHQLPAALEDAVPERERERDRRGIKVSSHTKTPASTDKHKVKYIKPRQTDKIHAQKN